MESFKKDLLKHLEHLKRSAKCKRYLCMSEKEDICWYLDKVKEYVEKHD